MTNNARSFDQEIRQEISWETTVCPEKRQVCNCCGRDIPVYPSPDAGEFVDIVKKWGYFSGKDGEIHRISVCESCYDAWVASFVIPPQVTENTELM